jgi:hypothetical protein
MGAHRVPWGQSSSFSQAGAEPLEAESLVDGPDDPLLDPPEAVTVVSVVTPLPLSRPPASSPHAASTSRHPPKILPIVVIVVPQPKRGA